MVIMSMELLEVDFEMNRKVIVGYWEDQDVREKMGN